MKNARQAARLNLRYLPYIFISWSMTTLGTGLEMFRLAANPAKREMYRGRSSRVQEPG
jgi:hypothetical protein